MMTRCLAIAAVAIACTTWAGRADARPSPSPLPINDVTVDVQSGRHRSQGNASHFERPPFMGRGVTHHQPHAAPPKGAKHTPRGGGHPHGQPGRLAPHRHGKPGRFDPHPTPTP